MAKKVNLKHSHHRKQNCSCTVADVNYYGDHFAICTCTESLPYAPESYTKLYASYVSIKLGGGEKKID